MHRSLSGLQGARHASRGVAPGYVVRQPFPEQAEKPRHRCPTPREVQTRPVPLAKGPNAWFRYRTFRAVFNSALIAGLDVRRPCDRARQLAVNSAQQLLRLLQAPRVTTELEGLRFPFPLPAKPVRR